MISSEVQRTLVKSPPELWAELSDPAALARHLGELGEIRIVRSDPETHVDWEAEGISGAVRLEPSGWGTKVTLTATRETPLPEPAIEPQAASPGSESACPDSGAPSPESQPVSPDSQAVSVAEVEPEPRAASAEPQTVSPTPPASSDPSVIEVEPESQRGFFARLFRRRKELTPEPVQAEHEAREPEPREEDPPDIAAELQTLEESLAAETAALLTAVLDRLGAAHHRPFSRA
jgi:hypothetical protein